MKSAFFLFFLSVFVVFGASQNARAADITPSDVYQKTEMLRLLLEKEGLIDTQLYAAQKNDEALRHPRHVIQTVRKCHTLLGKLMKAQGFVPEPLPTLHSVREIRPSDVMAGVEHLIEDAEKLGPHKAHWNKAAKAVKAYTRTTKPWKMPFPKSKAICKMNCPR